MPGDYDYRGAKLGGMIYANAVKAVQRVWEDLYGEQLTVSLPGREGFERLLDEVKGRLKQQNELKAVGSRLNELGYEVHNPETADVLFEELFDDLKGNNGNSGINSIDELTPREFKSAVYQQARAMTASGGRKDAPLDLFLRRTLDRLWAEKELPGRINVGENRNFHRMYQWLLEVVDETDWGTAQGLKLMNASLRGRVRADPVGPHGLLVRIDPNFI